MWYVIQVKSGDEDTVKELFEGMPSEKTCDKSRGRIFIPLYEEVRRSGGVCRIYFKRMFPGYVFAETDRPGEVFERIKQIPRFTRLLGREQENGDDEVLFQPLKPEEEDFLKSLLDDGIVHLSFVGMKGKRIEKVAGPLAGYRNHIAKLDLPHRRAIVETEIFGKRHKLRFGLWLTGDPENPWIREKIGLTPALPLDGRKEIDIGIRPGDIVRDDSGLFGDYRFTVEKVDTAHRVVHSSFKMGFSIAKISIDADTLSKV